MSDLNGVMMQYFHWYNPADGTLWEEVARNAKDLAEAGFTALWLPPAYKGFGGGVDVGYGAYDLYDLGEFDQKGSVRTKYGTREQYLAAIEALHAEGLQVYADAVLNHKIGGEEIEVAQATPYSQDDRINPKGETREVNVYTHFAFPGRNKKYSDFEWHWWHFDAVDYDDISKEPSTVFLFEGKRFDDDVALDRGNYSYLMGCDLDIASYDVQQELIKWGKWYIETTGVDGFRLDAVKHISAWFFPIWLNKIEKHAKKNFFVVGEYWSPDLNSLMWYLHEIGHWMSIFDVALHYNFHYASRANGQYDMRRILQNTLVQNKPTQAVTFVENHDSQPLQALESVVEAWFKPLAYALILLRREGYPSVFYADYYGAQYEDRGRDGNTYQVTLPSHRKIIDQLLYARKHYAWGPQKDYFDHWNRVGWTRLGDEAHPKAMAVLMSDELGGSKWMDVGKRNAKFVDLTGQIQNQVYSNQDGWGEFHCNSSSVSVWIEE